MSARIVAAVAIAAVAGIPVCMGSAALGQEPMFPQQYPVFKGVPAAAVDVAAAVAR
jgi:hypothetical protein